jgi:hypothetical protein
MTLNEMVLYIADQLNLSSPESKARIARNINVRYKRITSAIGMSTTRREEVSQAATIGNRNITFSGAEKLDAVYRKVGTKKYLLDEITMDDMLALSPRDEPPTKFAVYTIAPQSVTIQMDCIPTTTFTLYASVLADVSTLSNNDSPAFPESFHDIIIHGVMADEHRKAEKQQLAKEAEGYFEQRLSDLKMFIAKSAYLEIYPAKNRKSDGWWDTGQSK